MNRRRPWHQRLVRRIRQKTSSPEGTPSPLIIFAMVSLIACLAAMCGGLRAVALVFAASCCASLWRMRQMREGGAA